MDNHFLRVGKKIALLLVTMVLIFTMVRSIANLTHDTEPIKIEIPSGYSTGQIGSILKEQGVIDSVFWFKIKTRICGYTSQMKAGIYTFDVKSSINDAIEKLVNGEVAEYEDIRITIPEGLLIKDMAVIFEENGLFTADAFFEAIENFTPAYPWVAQIPDSMLQRYEGYLFPDTYQFNSNSTPEMVLKRMMDRFNQKIYEPYLASPINEQYSFHELVTLASIVEKETIIKDEFPIVASVFFNRLAINQGLESCATVQYILPVHREILLTADTEIKSPYNTYLYAGLPPGPIASFGLAAFEAVLEPADTDYYYFHSIGTNGGTLIFSKTLREHINSINANK